MEIGQKKNIFLNIINYKYTCIQIYYIIMTRTKILHAHTTTLSLIFLKINSYTFQIFKIPIRTIFES